MIGALPRGSVVACFVAGLLSDSPGSADTVSRALARGFRVWLVASDSPAGCWLSPPPAPPAGPSLFDAVLGVALVSAICLVPWLLYLPR
jgi:hypothetical protein